MQISERIEVHIAIELHMWPAGYQRCSFAEILRCLLNTPIPSIGEDQFLLVKRSRLEPTHVSVPDEAISDFRLQIRRAVTYDTLPVGRLETVREHTKYSQSKDPPP